MSTIRESSLIAVLGVAAIVANASQASGQARLAYVEPASTGSETADALHERAAALFTRPDRYVEAAALLVRAAGLRNAADQSAVKELTVAARLYAYAGRTREGRRILEEAAERALTSGNVLAAAHAYLDAAFLAIELEDLDDVRRLSARAEALAASPHLDDVQRATILARINPERLLGAGR